MPDKERGRRVPEKIPSSCVQTSLIWGHIPYEGSDIVSLCGAFSLRVAVSGESAGIPVSLVSGRGIKNAEAKEMFSTGVLSQGPLTG